MLKRENKILTNNIIKQCDTNNRLSVMKNGEKQFAVFM